MELKINILLEKLTQVISQSGMKHGLSEIQRTASLKSLPHGGHQCYPSEPSYLASLGLKKSTLRSQGISFQME